MTQKYREYMFSKPAELESAIRENPIAYIPFGALEWHGEHMVVGNDSIKATYICEKCAEITGGVLFPCINWGAFDTVNFPYTFHFNKKHLKKNARDMMDQLYKMGLRIVILLTGHYPWSQINNVKSAAQYFTRKYKDGIALGIPEQALVADLGYVGDHAAEWEASILMAIDPEYVDLSRVEQDLAFSERAKRHGIMGRDPTRHASLEKGRTILQEMINRLTAAIQSVRETQLSMPFEKIYENYEEALQKMYSLWHPLKLEKLFELQGIESTREMLKFAKWKFLKGGKQEKKKES